MLFALWNDACQVQGWTVRDDAQRHRVTREALGRNEDQPIPSWSNLDKVQISLLKQRLGVLAENLTAAMAEHPLHLRAQALWGIQASARAMCSLGPAYSQAATCAWEPYVRKVLYDLSRGQTDHFPDLPLTHHSCVDLTNLSKLLWNRLYSALRKWNAAHTLPLTNLKAYALQLRKDCMASA